MNKVNICSAVTAKETIISNIFVDRYMKDANGEFVKVYLYLLRHMNDVPGELSLCEIADSLNHTENDIVRALRYWSEHDVLNVDFDGTGVPVSKQPLRMNQLFPSAIIRCLRTLHLLFRVQSLTNFVNVRTSNSFCILSRNISVLR